MPEPGATGQAVGGLTAAGRGVLFLQIEPTTRCNFTCGFCAGRHMSQSDIDLRLFEKTLDALPDLQHLELQGEGEPLLHDDFFRMARVAKERGIAVSAITNGSLFHQRNIPRILDSGIDSLLVSIESPDPVEFRVIRGGKLEKVLDGIRALLDARNDRARRKPALGFAFTLMRDSRDRLAAVADLYRRLGMDGGILVQQLSGMESYARHYDTAMADQCLSGIGRLLSWAGAARTLRQVGVGEPAVPHFWHHLLAAAQEAGAAAQTLTFRACPWLEHGLYVDRNGVATACPKIKDTERFALGVPAHNGLGPVLTERAVLREMLDGGTIPEPCRGCSIGESVVHGRPGRDLGGTR